MKLIKFAFTGLLLSGLLTGCTKEETKIEQAKTEETKVEQVKAEAQVNDPKNWKDVSTPEGFNNYGIEPTLEAWIAYHAEDIAKTTDINEYYPKADRFTNEMKYFRIQGDDLEKDFENLNVLPIFMGHLVYVISEQDKQGIGTAETYDELNEAFKYFTELLHDLDIIINYDGKGETFGVTNQLDGNKVNELESFLYVN